MQWAGYLSALVVTNESGSELRRVHPPFICQRPRLVPRFIFGFHFFNVDNNRHIGKPGKAGESRGKPGKAGERREVPRLERQKSSRLSLAFVSGLPALSPDGLHGR